jgi:heterodisulfide reductase subunit C
MPRIPRGALHSDLVTKIAEISGQNVYKCMQCGTCASVCPMCEDMEISTRQAMLMLQHGMVDELVQSKTPWLCASCHTCQARCPRGLELTRIMEAVRLIALRKGIDAINPREIVREDVIDMPQIALVAGFRKLTA